MEIARHLGRARRRAVEFSPHPVGVGEKTAAGTEHHAAVRGRAVIIHQRARIRNRHAVRPARGFEPLRKCLRGDDIAADDENAAAELGKRGRPGVHRNRRLVGTHRPARRDDARRASAFEAPHRRVFENSDALRQGGAAEATREVRRLHSRAGGLENAGDMLVGARARRHLIGRPFLEWMPLVPGQGFDHRTPGPVLRPVCRRPQPAVPAEFAVDVMGGAKVRHLIHAMRRGLGETNRFVRGAEGCERAETAPPAQHEATIASARAVAAAVLFDNHDIERRLALL